MNELIHHTLNINTSTPKEFKGIKVSKKVSEANQILQYAACFGAAFDPVSFVTQETIQEEEKRSSIFGTIIVFAASLVLCIALGAISFMQLFDAKNREGELAAKEARLQPIEDRYNQLKSIEDEFLLYQVLNRRVDTANNSLHRILTDIAKISPKNFKINSITTTEDGATMSATTADRLSSISAMKMKLNTMFKDIIDISIASVSESTDQVTKRRQYNYTIIFTYLSTVAEEVEINE
jgi:hypothetical protein